MVNCCMLPLIELLIALVMFRILRLSCSFDEMHFGRYAGMYLRNTFYFDIHPPLGKLLFAAAASYGGFDPEFKFDKIGAGEKM